MFTSELTKGISFSRVLNGISKTLNVVNEVIPIYNQAKPIINKGKGIISALSTISLNKEEKEENRIEIHENKKRDLNNLPIFFS